MDAHLETMVKELEEGKAQLFDVREQNEWDAGHLKSAILVPLSELKGGAFPEDQVSSSQKTYLHCRSGNRVHTAHPILEALGFQEVIPLDEGYEQLVYLGFEKG